MIGARDAKAPHSRGFQVLELEVCQGRQAPGFELQLIIWRPHFVLSRIGVGLNSFIPAENISTCFGIIRS